MGVSVPHKSLFSVGGPRTELMYVRNSEQSLAQCKPGSISY